MMKKKTPLLLLFFSIIFISSCRHNNETFFSEGVIDYTAVAVDQSNSMASLAPNKMTLEFKNNKSCAQLSAGMGLFKMSVISDPKTLTVTRLVSLMSTKFAHIYDSAEVKKEMDQFPPFRISETNETKIIAGYKCKKAMVSFLDKKNPDFAIYYTNDINVVKPNWCNPFHAIDGMLMEYQIKSYGLEMKFTATSVTKKEIDDKDFEMPKGFVLKSAKEMDEFFKSISE